MNRRFLISSLAALPFISTARAAVPYSAQFLAGGFDGKAYSAGLLVKLDSGWKTYWRNPGEAGIPPSITAEPNSNFASITVDFPLPIRIKDESGTAFGYHDEVLFPLMITPKDVGEPLSVHLSSFFGVCQKVCTPAKSEAMLSFSPKSPPTPDGALIALWQKKVPTSSQKITEMANIKGKRLSLKLDGKFDDIFIEGPDRYYFGPPIYDSKSNEFAIFDVHGLKNDSELKGVELRITANANGQGLEQRVVVA